MAHDGSEGELGFEQAILATGSRPFMLPGVTTGERVIDSTGALELQDVPKSLLVVGGGYIGLEAAAVARKLGLEVTVVELAPRILSRVAAAETAEAVAGSWWRSDECRAGK